MTTIYHQAPQPTPANFMVHGITGPVSIYGTGEGSFLSSIDEFLKLNSGQVERLQEQGVMDRNVTRIGRLLPWGLASVGLYLLLK